jgi:fructose-1,6-bisphosphatase
MQLLASISNEKFEEGKQSAQTVMNAVLRSLGAREQKVASAGGTNSIAFGSVRVSNAAGREGKLLDVVATHLSGRNP